MATIFPFLLPIFSRGESSVAENVMLCYVSIGSRKENCQREMKMKLVRIIYQRMKASILVTPSSLIDIWQRANFEDEDVSDGEASSIQIIGIGTVQSLVKEKQK